jgi:hypothetical protein
MYYVKDEDGRVIMPDLIELPVYRDDFISQQRVDELCKFLWNAESWRIKQLILAIDDSEHHHRFDTETMRDIAWEMRKIRIYLREEASKGAIDPLSDLQMCDFLYEVERRLRVFGGYKEFEPAGKPLAPTPQGPFPEHGDIAQHIFEGTEEAHFAHWPTTEVATYSPQRMVNYKALCEEHPEKLFAYGEEFRRGRAETDVSDFVEKALNKK